MSYNNVIPAWLLAEPASTRSARIIRREASPQVRVLYNHLAQRGSISAMEAQAVHRIRSLSRRICDLKDLNDRFNLGMAITREFHEDVTGQRYVRYNFAN